MCGIEITPSKDGRLSRDCLKRGDVPVIVSIITDSYSSRHSGCPLTHSSVCESLCSAVVICPNKAHLNMAEMLNLNS